MNNYISKIKAAVMLAVVEMEIKSDNLESDVYYMNGSERTSRVFYDRMRLCPFSLFYRNEKIAVTLYLYDDGTAVVVGFAPNGRRIFEKEFSYFLSPAQTKELARWLIDLENKKIVFRPLRELALYAASYDAQKEEEKRQIVEKMIEKFFDETADMFPEKKLGTNRAYYRIQRKNAIRRKCDIVRNVYNCVPYDDDPQSGKGFCKYAGQYGKGKIHESASKVRGRNVLSPCDRRKKERDDAAYDDYITGGYIFSC